MTGPFDLLKRCRTEQEILGWADQDRDEFAIQATMPGDRQRCSAIATLHVYNSSDGSYNAVSVDEGDALALIDWLQICVRQASSVSHGIPHTDAPVTKDQTK